MEELIEKLKNAKNRYEQEHQVAVSLKDEGARLKQEAERMKMQHALETDQIKRESQERESKIKTEHKNLVD